MPPRGPTLRTSRATGSNFESSLGRWPSQRVGDSVLAAGSTTAAPGVVWAVVGVALGAGVVCILFGVIFAFSEREAVSSVRSVVGTGRPKAPAKGKPQGGPLSPLAGTAGAPPTPVEEQAGIVDFGGLAQLA